MKITVHRQLREVPCNYPEAGDQYLPTDDPIKKKSLFTYITMVAGGASLCLRMKQSFLSILTVCRRHEKCECVLPAPKPAIKLIVLGNNQHRTLAPAISIKRNERLWRAWVQIEPTWLGLTDRVQYGNKSQRRCLKPHCGRPARVELSASLSDAAWNGEIYMAGFR